MIFFSINYSIFYFSSHLSASIVVQVNTFRYIAHKCKNTVAVVHAVMYARREAHTRIIAQTKVSFQHI